MTLNPFMRQGDNHHINDIEPVYETMCDNHHINVIEPVYETM